MRQGARIISRVRWALGDCTVTRGGNKGSELAIRYRVGIGEEAGNPHAVRRPLFRIMLVRPHAKGAAGNPDHIGVVLARAINLWVCWEISRETGHRRIPTRPNA